ncbi:MAG TPA: SMC family ATPase [Firmicutes bacterium]|nr:SMC family ATPase [Bacillota bacterium]
MKPILLKITAFGPFAKQTVLNFKEDLAGQDIFVVTGPTGAGKTTIFDAMCYALYGETSGGKRTGKELRSDFITADDIRTAVEFTFSVKGKTYEVMRAPQYSRKKKRGDGYTEVSSDQYIKEVGSTEPPLTKGGEVDAKVKEILGLDAKQFRKIVMIPQGDFKDFLMANTGDKEQILRQIFGTDLFRQLQDNLEKQAKRLKTSVLDTEKQIRAQFKSFKSCDEEGFNTLLKNNEQIKTLLDVCETEISKSLDEIKQLNQDVNDLKGSQQSAEKEYEAANKIVEKFIQLDKVVTKLAMLQEQLSHYTAISQKISFAKLAEEVRIEEKVVEDKQRSLNQTVLSLNTTKQELEKLTHDFEGAKVQYESIEALEKQMDSHQGTIQTLLSYEGDVIELVNHRQSIETLTQALKQGETELMKKTEVIALMKVTIDGMDDLQRQMFDETQDLNKVKLELQSLTSLEKQLDHLAKRLASYVNTKQNLKMIEEKLASVSHAVEKLGIEHQEMAMLHMNSQAIRLAKELKVDMPCPVCGSTEHPNPAPTDVDVPTTEMVQAKYREKETMQAQVQHVSNQKAEAMQKISLDEEQLQDLLNDLVSVFGTSTLESINTEKVVTKLADTKLLKEKLTAQHEKHQKNVTILETQFSEAKVQKDKLAVVQSQHDELEASLKGNQDKLKKEETLIEVIVKRVPLQFQDLVVLKDQLNREEEQRKTLVQQKSIIISNYQKLSNEIAAKNSTVDQLTTSHETQVEELNRATQSFNQCLSERFESQEIYSQSQLTKQEVQELEQDVKAYDQEVYATNQIMTTLQLELTDVVRPDLASYKEIVETIKVELEAKQKNLSEKNVTSKYNQDLINRIKESYEGIKKQEEQYAMVGDLAEMATGKGVGRMTFETYVLSSYFDEVLQQANERLQKMTAKRYYLLRREEVRGGGKKGLDLDVYDAHTCKTRAVNTLSGGESFKASLALALGLADTVQFNAGGIQLDTMFIDEGFGTLDSESLDQAIDILMDLQDNGRLIGVISHVAELKQQIPAKLIVESSPSGSTAYFKK